MSNPDKYQNKYRIKSARKEGYNYGQNGRYFVTIVTKDRKNHFGEIQNNVMQYSEIGQFALKCWNEIPNHFPFVTLDEFVLMTNHVHGIIEIDKPPVATPISTVATQDLASLHKIASLQTNDYKNKFGPQSKNLASIIRGFKIGITKFARQNTKIHTVWQPRYHDRIIRNQQEYIRIKKYIINNPLNWNKDKNNL